ncbi:hypothetical protein MKX03_026547, partial [Papaver bracteatum]
MRLYGETRTTNLRYGYIPQSFSRWKKYDDRFGSYDWQWIGDATRSSIFLYTCDRVSHLLREFYPSPRSDIAELQNEDGTFTGDIWDETDTL